MVLGTFVFLQILLDMFYFFFMLTYIVLALLLAVLYFFYRYYFQPKAEIKRYVKLFKSLGYSVYEQQFSFFGVSVGTDWDNGEKIHKDALYT